MDKERMKDSRIPKEWLRHDDRLQDEIGTFFIYFKEHFQC